jgi:hypothetical protein
MNYKFNHVGVPTKTKQAGETYNDGMKVHLTDYTDHPYNFEYLRFEPGSWLPAEMQIQPHIAIEVDNIDSVLKDFDKVIVEKMDAGEQFLCFAVKDNVIFELMQIK